ncbi:MAG TPA: hypothetical protein VK918_06965, partial [Pyrinomonadaceae bacterium]|nr:hypothetical protein [Pyrinomonadaceae bacterium]
MKKFYLLIAVLLMPLIAAAQPANGTPAEADPPSTANPASSNVVEMKPVSAPPARAGKVVVPPEKLRAINIPKIESMITVDGRLNEEAWATAAVFKDFYQTSPGNNIAPSRPTEVYMMYDEKHLYIGFKCWDERDKVRA